jgi:outer membrane protein assembly factor BamB
MSDQELIDLLMQKAPEDLSFDELTALKARLLESPRLREVLFDQLQMETYLTAALSRVEITPEQILARAKSAHTSTLWVWWGAATAVVLAAGIGVWAYSQRGNSPREIISLSESTAPKTKSEVASPEPADALEAESGATPMPEIPEQTITPDPPPMKAAPAKVAKAPATPAAPPPAPWDEVLARQGEQPAFREVCFDNFVPERSIPRADTLAAWFEPVPGFFQRLKKAQSRFGKCEEFEGLVKLKCPWTYDSALKMSLENFNRLQWHFFSGDTGVTIIYYEDQNYRWAAYQTSRQKGSARPESWTLTSTDDERCKRTELRFGGPFELRYRDGQVIVTRGDVPLVAAPLPGPPEEVYLDGKAMFYGLALVRTKDDPPPISDRPVTVWKTETPAELDWLSRDPKLPPLEKLPDGGVRLVADNQPARSEWFVTLPPATTPRDVIIELKDITFGAGIYWGKANGELVEALRLCRNARDKAQAGISIRGNDDNADQDFPPPRERPSALASDKLWLRYRVGCGNFRWWMSADGVHWAQPEPARDGYQGDIVSLGLQIVAKRPQASITVKRIEIRELPALASLAPAALRQQAALAAPIAATVGEWREKVLAAQPAGADAAVWLRASVLATLGRGASKPLALELLEALLDDPYVHSLGFSQQQAVLSEALGLCVDFRNGQGMQIGVVQRHFDLAEKAFETEGLRPLTFFRAALAFEPLSGVAYPELSLAPLVRTEAVQLLDEGRLDAAYDFAKMLAFNHVNQIVPLVAWLESASRRGLPARVANEQAPKLKDGWRNPLIEELSKDAYNRSSELAGFLESESWDEAAQMITSLTPDAAPGLAPAAQDRALLVALPTAIRLTLETYPPLAQAVAEKFQPLARLRLEQAIATADADAVELIAAQFPGSEAASEAHQWLGDRALASGWFDRALAEYRIAGSEHTSTAVRGAIGPRLRLAGAMLGHEIGERPVAAVSFHDRKFAPEEFEQLVAELRGRAGRQFRTLRSITAGEPAYSVPEPGEYAIGVKARLDGMLGDKPEIEGARMINQLKIPWVDRQLAATVEGNTLYVANRFQVAAYNLDNGQRVWQSAPGLGAKVQQAQAWPLVPMRPLITEERIFVRQLLQRTAPWLACIERASGKTEWTQTLGDHEYLVSDPLWMQGQLVALTLLADERSGGLRWTVFDPDTGVIREQRDLVRLRPSWLLRRCCEIASLEDGLVITLGGATLGCSAAGEVRWVRTHTMLPPEEDPGWVQQFFQRPIISGGNVLVAQPGVATVDCLVAATGRKIWSRIVPGLIGMVGMSGEQLILQTSEGMRALQCGTGEPVWERELAGIHPATACDTRVLVATHSKAKEGNKLLTRLTWIDGGTGKILAEQDVAGLEADDPRLGLLIPHQAKLWTFFGQGQTDPSRDLVELTRK